MKLKKLMEEMFPTTINSINTNRTIQDKPMSGDNIGSGNYSSVADKKNDPFMVRKTSATNRGPEYDAKKHDGYWTYIEGIIKNPELKNNPFLPRVYNIKTLKDPRGKPIYRADIEKLESINNINDKLFYDYFSTILDKEKLNKIVEKINPMDIKYKLVSIIDEAAYTTDFGVIINKQLQQALEYIHSLSGDFIVDIHENNIMFRRGPYGIQMVITDPLSAPI